MPKKTNYPNVIFVKNIKRFKEEEEKMHKGFSVMPVRSHSPEF